MFSACRWLALCAALAAQEKPDLVFGTTVVSTTGLKGSIYILKKDTTWLPNLTKMKPVGEIYTTSLRVTPRNFTAGFPGVTDRNEWFAIGYEGRFWVEQPGRYRFQTTSDDGSKLLIDGKVLVDNDGVHAMTRVEGSALLTRGIHTMRWITSRGQAFTSA
ncbi:MAG: beta-glucosidase [Acidobacteria bacterium]|nr:beta-glucosidase [Acidobacteriota bacterium]